MTFAYDIDVSGTKGHTNPKTPVDGFNGPTLGPDGNGHDGKESWWTCERSATGGENGLHGEGAPGADNGANGGDAFSISITCSEFVGPGLRMLNMGGDGAHGNDAGHGGTGSDGGNAGKQPSACKQVINGGIGGNAGNGGNAGSGGNGGNAGQISLVYGPGFSAVPLSAYSGGGGGGDPGTYGSPGQPGLGGYNSDGTRAASGAEANYGDQGLIGLTGKGGSFTARQDASKAPTFMRIIVKADVTV